ncbi:MAG: metal ABC transporter permease [Propionibacteriaceae bacterium]|jgi:zinc transport system permease protein|nr:metal ABC transporter permease [Propionibacteriaceae bacterium]
MDFLTFAFVQRALLASGLVGISAPTIGTYIVQRRLSLLGDGLGHVAIAGVGLALMTGTAPLPWAIGICVAGALLIETLRQKGRASGDVGLAVLFYGGLAAGVLMASVAGQGAGGLSSYLFGSLNTISASDLGVVAGLAVLILVVALGLSPQLFAISADEEFARTLGLPVRFYNYLIVALAAITVTTAMRTVGLLLVSALMVIPVAAAQNVFRGFWRSMWAAMTIGLVASVAGYLVAAWANLAPGAMIVLITITFFVASLPIASLMHRHWYPHRDEVDPTGAPHEPTDEHGDHVHGPGCGHPAISHGDHIDYIHGGHLHAPHGDHYDEH